MYRKAAHQGPNRSCDSRATRVPLQSPKVDEPAEAWGGGAVVGSLVAAPDPTAESRRAVKGERRWRLGETRRSQPAARLPVLACWGASPHEGGARGDRKHGRGRAAGRRFPGPVACIQVSLVLAFECGHALRGEESCPGRQRAGSLHACAPHCASGAPLSRASARAAACWCARASWHQGTAPTGKPQAQAKPLTSPATRLLGLVRGFPKKLHEDAFRS